MHSKAIYALLSVVFVPALAACTSAPTPKTASLYAPKVVVTGTQPVSATPVAIANKGVYPTFGPPITAANRQMDDIEARQLQAQMVSLTASRDTGKITEAEYQKQLIELNRLAATHASQMQTQIGN